MIKTIKKPTERRQGTLIDLVDAIQKLIHMQYDDNLLIEKGENYEYNPEVVNKIMSELTKLRVFDITKIGDLYLTSGDRIVLDKGYGEYFGVSDIVLFKLEELTTGMNSDTFIKQLSEKKKDRKKLMKKALEEALETKTICKNCGKEIYLQKTSGMWIHKHSHRKTVAANYCFNNKDLKKLTAEPRE